MRKIMFCLAWMAALAAGHVSAAELPLEQIKLPPGFQIEVWARVENARQMTLGRSGKQGGTLFVGTREAGTVHALTFDGNYKVKQSYTLADDLPMPVGVAYRNGSLYVSAIHRILRFDDIEARLANPPKPQVVIDTLPKNREHGWKFIAFGPDGKLYVPVGAPCNICEPDPQRYANIMRMNPDGSGLETYAQGIRNSVGFDWHPVNGSLWFTDNGRDLLGDNIPSDELNTAPRAGMHFGYPYCHAGNIADPEFGSKHSCGEFTPPVQKLGAHVAALGMRFYTGEMFPAEYRNEVFIAEHGSWNRAKKIGYRVMLVKLKDRQAVSYETFASGWLQNETAWGRPVDVLTLPDGSLLISDDFAGAIYRVTYRK